MEEMIEARVAPAKVWDAWEKAHRIHSEKGIEPGVKSHSRAEGKSKFKYQILDVVPGKSFSILWKTLFVRLIFTHRVTSTKRGSEISYNVQIKGLFAWPVRWLLGKQIQKNIRSVLKQIVSQLELNH
jgi:hypothetical protein